MEIIIKTKQKYNPRFSFLHHDDRLFPYYKQLLHAISSGSYTPPPSQNNNNNQTKENGDLPPASGEEKVKEEEEEEKGERERERKRRSKRKWDSIVPAYSDDDVNDDSFEQEGTELHPLLRSVLVPAKKATPKTTPTTTATSTVTSLSKISINSAPTVTMETTTNSETTETK